ncbi:SRPBCC domain-containing protein [Terrimonas sp. NA20]|uniref:SRPBCC domain-containing protein n=1 Tax=Terrimonas ginsenosidimutans TaxID=2908004 RepID=A0ABS9KKT8_9BACT|nr:SRPBCC domain-containing protein [Terrimonas ginsenosidimutans]MCG2612933.1 SRPBCC domain-containing protein [Terrimonas ginsenosidimutans]
MEKLHFDIDIDAPAVAVFNAITDKKKYVEWSSAFNPTSTFEGGWEKGDKIHFIGTNKEGKKEGMVSRIKENIPYKQISIQHLGFLDGDKEITEGPGIEKWANAMEEYFLEETNGKTKFSVSMDITEDFKDYMSNTWPKALEKLKEVAERG